MNEGGAQRGVGGNLPLLELAGVSRIFPGPPPVTALRDATLAVRGGEMLAIVGPSGSGKSTLLNVLGLLDEPTAGTRYVLGVDTASMGERERTAVRAKRLGFVFQAFHLVPYLDCVANVSLPLVHQAVPRGQRRARAVEALETVGLGHRLGARPTTLSGGEQQRVAIARAVVHHPAVVLCDEPTGNLDSASTRSVLDLLRGLVRAERSVVVVTHEAEVEAVVHRVIRVADGVAHG